MLKKTLAFATVAAVVLTVAASGSIAVRAETRDVVDTAIAAGSFKTLAKALDAAGLVTTLKGAGPFTVFAPTDEAFAKLPDGTIETLLKPENKEKLRRILTYHVVAGRVMASDVVKLQSAKAVSGDTITVKVADGVVHVDNATVTSADVLVSNGVIHVIDSVILPKGL
jgi:transforming growth factor-beta-induced protein